MQHPLKAHFNYPTTAMINYTAVAVPLNNEAIALFRQGDYAGAEAKHVQALAIKERDFGQHDYRVAITLNGLGEAQLRQGKLDEAEANLRRALAIREADDAHDLDAAVSRENLAQLCEVRGNFPEAKKLRMSGKPTICCGNYECPGSVFKKHELKACSACKSVFYCTPACQKRDWKTRHRKYCTATK